MITEAANHVYTDQFSWTIDDTCEGITEAEAEVAAMYRPADLDDGPPVGSYYLTFHERTGECYVAGRRGEWVMFPESMEAARRAVRDLNNGAPEWFVRGYPIGEEEQLEWAEFRAFHAGQLA